MVVQVENEIAMISSSLYSWVVFSVGDQKEWMSAQYVKGNGEGVRVRMSLLWLCACACHVLIIIL